MIISRTVYLPTVYVDEKTGCIIEKKELRNLSYTSRLEQHEEVVNSRKIIHSVRIIKIKGVQQSLNI